MMQGFDVILAGLMIGAFVVLCAALLLGDFLSRRSKERAARNRLKWLSRRIKGFSLSHSWRWFYRRGIRQGIKIGKRLAEQHGFQHIEVVNRCKPHGSDLVAQFVQLSDGRLVQGWFCPNWQEHTLQTLPETNTMPAAMYTQQVELRRRAAGLIDTQEVQKMPKKVRLPS